MTSRIKPNPWNNVISGRFNILKHVELTGRETWNNNMPFLS